MCPHIELVQDPSGIACDRCDATETTRNRPRRQARAPRMHRCVRRRSSTTRRAVTLAASAFPTAARRRQKTLLINGGARTPRDARIFSPGGQAGRRRRWAPCLHCCTHLGPDTGVDCPNTTGTATPKPRPPSIRVFMRINHRPTAARSPRGARISRLGAQAGPRAQVGGPLQCCTHLAPHTGVDCSNTTATATPKPRHRLFRSLCA